jgi:secreted trypsin-like serine protease
MRRSVKGLIMAAAALALVVPAGISMAAADPEPITPNIIGGSNASQTYSFMTSLQSNGGGHFCGGSLVRPDWVVTAKHCLAGESTSTFQMRIGSTQRSSGGTVARPDKIALHPSADLAVVHLSAPVSQQPVPVASSAPVSTAIRIIGWGCTKDPNCGPAPETLQELDTSILADNACGGNATSICVNNPGGNRGACYGDSGGPAVRGTTGSFELVGATHGGTGICGTNPSIYTDTAALKSWIEGLTGNTGGGGVPSANLALNKAALGSSPCVAGEAAAKAFNGTWNGGNADKFCSATGGVKTLTVDLGSKQAIKTIVVHHAAAGGESATYNTRDYDIQVSDDGITWQTVAQIRSNTAATTTHQAAVAARHVRLSISAGAQDNSPVVRIYEVEVFA